MGPIKPASFRGSKYIMTFVDDFSRMSWTYLLTLKSEAFSVFLEWKAMVENTMSARLKTLRTDNGGEYVNHSFEEFMKTAGIPHQTTVPRTPEQNGVAERWNRTMLEKARCMMQGAGRCIPQSLWGEAISAATYLSNRSPHSGVNELKTPYELFYKRKPAVDHLRTWGCMTTVLLPESERTKFGSKTYEGILVGYSTSQKGYRIYNPKTHNTKVVRDVRFFEDRFMDSPTAANDDEEFIWPDDWSGELPEPKVPEVQQDVPEDDRNSNDGWTTIRRKKAQPLLTHKKRSQPLALLPPPNENRFSILEIDDVQDTGVGDETEDPVEDQTHNGATDDRDVNVFDSEPDVPDADPHTVSPTQAPTCKEEFTSKATTSDIQL